MRNLLAGACVAALTVTAAQAEVTPRAGKNDSRVRTVNYYERDVTNIHSHYGFTTVVEFSPTEEVLTASIGDQEAWQVVRPEQGNLLFIKPLERRADTNLTVVTNKRMYLFALFADEAKSGRSSALTFRVKFTYANEGDASTGVVSLPATPPKASPVVEASFGQPGFGPAASPEDWNLDYSYAGSDALRPVRVFDDGQFTYFKFSGVRRTPAVFTVGDDRHEATVNYSVRGDYVVVETVAEQFTLRDGDEATCIFNAAYPDTEHDDLSPPKRGKGDRIVSALPRREVPQPAGARPRVTPSSSPVNRDDDAVVAAVRAPGSER